MATLLSISGVLLSGRSTLIQRTPDGSFRGHGGMSTLTSISTTAQLTSGDEGGLSGLIEPAVPTTRPSLSTSAAPARPLRAPRQASLVRPPTRPSCRPRSGAAKAYAATSSGSGGRSMTCKPSPETNVRLLLSRKLPFRLPIGSQMSATSHGKGLSRPTWRSPAGYQGLMFSTSRLLLRGATTRATFHRKSCGRQGIRDRRRQRTFPNRTGLVGRTHPQGTSFGGAMTKATK